MAMATVSSGGEGDDSGQARVQQEPKRKEGGPTSTREGGTKPFNCRPRSASKLCLIA